jgi:hypothetical protein
VIVEIKKKTSLNLAHFGMANQNIFSCSDFQFCSSHEKPFFATLRNRTGKKRHETRKQLTTINSSKI